MSVTMAPLVPALDDAARRGTGCLHVTGPEADQQAQIFFDDGLVYAAHVHTFSPLIGRRLLSNGSLTSDQYDTLVARANGNERDPALGVQAVKSGYFRQDVLDGVLEEILAAAFVDVLSWATPATKFKRRARTHHLTAPRIQITTLLQAARRRSRQWVARWEAVGCDPSLVRPVAVEVDHDDDPDGVSRLLAAADGTLGLRALGHVCGLTYFEAGEAFLDLHTDGRITFLLPAASKDSAMHPVIPVTHIASAVDAVPGLSLPPLPNFDGQTLPPQPAPLSDSPEAASPEAAPVEPAPVEPAPPRPPVSLPLAAAQGVVTVEFDMADALADVDGEPDNASPVEADPDTAPLDAVSDLVASPDAHDADDSTTPSPVEDPDTDTPVTDTRVVARRSLLADELDAAAEAVRLAESTIERFAREEQDHQSAVEQSLAHQHRYEAFLSLAEAERQRLLDESAAVAAEAESLAATAESLQSRHATLGDALTQVEERAAAAASALEEARRHHEAAMQELAQTQEAATEVATMLDEANAAADANRTAAAQVVDDLTIVDARTVSYAAEIAEAGQSAADLKEAAQASARLRERAEQRLAAAQTTLSAKAAEHDR